MKAVCLRVDLDYVPWDSPDARDFGHGEPAMLLRLLESARRSGLRLHFFASERVLRAFPTQADAVLDEGHDLDYLAKHPAEGARTREAMRLFAAVGHAVEGWAVRSKWPEGLAAPPGVRFFSGPADASPPGTLYPTVGRTLHDAVRAGSGLRSWLDATLPELERDGGTVVLSPQVLARVDPRLAGLEEIVRAMAEAGVVPRTLRELSREGDAPL